MSREVLSRRLFIGLGHYGSLVARELRRHLRQEAPEPNRRTSVLAFQSDTPPFEGFQGLSRRGVRDRFMESGAALEVFQRIEKAVSNCARMPPMQLDASDMDPWIYVFLIADLSDPFGGGLLLDAARLVRIAALGREHSILGILGLGLFLPDERGETYIQRQPGYCNGCAAARELDHALAHGLGDEFNYQDPVPAAGSEIPFDQCFLLTEANPSGALRSLDEHARFVTRFLLQFCRGEFLRKLDSFPKQVASSGQAPRRPLYGSFGLASAFLPLEDVHAYCMERWARDVVDVLTVKRAVKTADPAAPHEELRSCLPVSPGAVATEIERHARPLPDTSVPGGFPVTYTEAAGVLLTIVDQLERASKRGKLPRELGEFIHKEYLAPFRRYVRSQVDRLVEQTPSGIAQSRALLDRLYVPEASRSEDDAGGELSTLLASSLCQKEQEEEKAEDRLERVRQRLQQARSRDSGPSVPMRPCWLFRPLQYLEAVRQRRQVRSWAEDWRRELDELREGLRKMQIAEYTYQVFAALKTVVDRERHLLENLVCQLNEAAGAVAKKYREHVLEPLSVDQALIPENCYETIYLDCLSAADFAGIEDAVSRLLVSDSFLAGFRQLSADRLAEPIDKAGRSCFAPLMAFDVDSVLGDSRYTGGVVKPSDLTTRLWQRAAPLIDTSGGIVAQDWGVAELSAVWVPNPESDRTYGPEFAEKGRHPQMFAGASARLDSCRIVHGFTLEMTAVLQTYVPSYQSREEKSDLHILDWLDQLPPLPGKD